LASTQAEKAAKIDAMMERASRALVKRDYFEAERLAAGALRRAHHEGDFARMARIIMPLQEARRLKRDMAYDAGKVFVVEGELPHGKALVQGCYLIGPPRVGVDGRMLRDLADERHVPVVVVVREPTSRDGLWPIVAVGPVTVRAKVAPPKPPPPKKPKKAAKSKAKLPAPEAPKPTKPTVEWFIQTCERLGDEAIDQVAATLPAASRADALFDRLEAHPNHEKLHQRLEEACRQAMIEPPRKRRLGFNDDFPDDILRGEDE
jgi:hypothetical protein